MTTRRHGFSLIELLVAASIAGIAAIYMLGTFAASNRAYTTIDQISESQQNLRAVAALLERDMRHAGMMVELSAGVCASDNTGAPDLLYLSDADALAPDKDDLAPYPGAVIQGGVGNVAGTQTLAVDSLMIEPNPPLRAAYDVDADGTNDSDFQVGGGAIVMDRFSPGRGVACGTITAVNTGGPSITVQFTSGTLDPAGGATQLFVVPAHEYRIVNGDQLRRNGMLMTEGVEDLQVSFFFDLNDDNLVDAGERQGDGVGADYVAQGTDMSPLTELRVNLVTRTRLEDPDFEGQLQLRENRAAGAPTDGFRRRVHTTTVLLRNIESRLST